MDKILLLVFLTLTWPLRYLPYRMIHQLGKGVGLLVYYTVPKFRKRALSNLALATTLHLSEMQIRRYAKESLQNLAITCLEYLKFASETDIQKIAHCVNPDVASQLMNDHKPVIFFCGHQSNWEVLFLEGTSRMPGAAIGRPIKNAPLYRFLLDMRQKFGGIMLAPQNALKEGLRALKKGLFLGIVGDQGMPNSGYCSAFFGRTAWTSPAPAILAHRLNLPIIVATTLRKEGKYRITYSDPIWPNPDAPLQEEIDRLMQASLQILEKTIAEEPGQWLWSHNRWKQQTPDKLKKAFRHESILLILPQEQIEELLPHLSYFREIYPREFFTVYVPKAFSNQVILENAEIVPYSHDSELFKRDLRFKLVFNFTQIKAIKTHFKKLSAFTVVSLEDLKKCSQETVLPQILQKSLLKNHAS